ncbi:MAG: hypothetical protein ACM3QU_09815 [Verrucomicrobiota bacterium]
MSETNGVKIAWRRGERGPVYVGSVSRAGGTIRLTGRDPILGIDVALSIPAGEIEYIGVAEAAVGSIDAGPVVVLDLPESEPIHLRPVGGGSSLDVHLLARALGALTLAPTVLAQGGRT